MANSYSFSMTGKRAIISLHRLSHEVCVAATQEEYWKKLTHNSNISIISQGIYVPEQLEQFCNDNDEPRLQLIIQSQSEQDNQQFDDICAQIRRDLKSFENRDSPVFDPQTRDVIVYGSLFNSLPPDIFDTDRNLLGQRNCNIKKIRHSFGSSIFVDQSIPQRYKFTIHHENQTIMDLTAIQLQALVRQTQDQYIIAFATKRGRALIEPIGKTEVASSSSSSSNPNDFPSFTSFQHSTSKRKRNDDEEQQQQQTTTNQNVFDSDQSDTETVPDEERENSRQEAEHLLNRICDIMQARIPKTEVAQVREDTSQIQSYFRYTGALKTGDSDLNLPIEVVNREIDLRSRDINEHKCTIIFNKQLKIGGGVRDRLKKTAKIRAYEQLKTLTRNTPRENLILKRTKDHLWTAVIKPSNTQ